MSEAAPHLVVRSVSKKYGPTTVLDHIDLTIRRGERWCVMGRNGARVRLKAFLRRQASSPSKPARYFSIVVVLM